MDKTAALADIDRILAIADDFSEHKKNYDIRVSAVGACIERWAPPASFYLTELRRTTERKDDSWGLLPLKLAAILRTLRGDIVANQLASFAERVRADVLTDLLSQAESLNGDGFRRAACVLAGASLENHLRELAVRHGIPVVTTIGNPEKASVINDRLRTSANAYGKAEGREVQAWLALLRQCSRARAAA